MKKKPNILITNDDGIHAPGLRHLWECLRSIANINIIAPLTEKSGVGLAITIRDPLRIEKVETFPNTPAWSVSGTPADCVKMAIKVIYDQPPDIIVTGINRGSNAGRNVLYSGTVAGAIEGVMHNIPSIAFSCWENKDPDYSRTSPFIPRILNYVLEHPMPSGTLLNVNFPRDHLPIQGVKLTRQGKEFWEANPDKRQHPVEEHSYYWMGAKLAEFDEEHDSDIAWLRQGYAAAVPVHVHELTDHMHLRKQKAHFDSCLGE